MLDYQSRTSVSLVKILLKEYWKIQPVLVDANEDFREKIKEEIAGVIIGDRALAQRKISPYIFDLGEAWKGLTGLPFVFAAWISNKKLDPGFVRLFDQANGMGTHDIKSVLATLDYNDFNLREYYTKYISYELDASKREGLDLFVQKLKQGH